MPTQDRYEKTHHRESAAGISPNEPANETERSTDQNDGCQEIGRPFIHLLGNLAHR